jgi:hypothetical protein
LKVEILVLRQQKNVPQSKSFFFKGNYIFFIFYPWNWNNKINTKPCSHKLSTTIFVHVSEKYPIKNIISNKCIVPIGQFWSMSMKLILQAFYEHEARSIRWWQYFIQIYYCFLCLFCLFLQHVSYRYINCISSFVLIFLYSPITCFIGNVLTNIFFRVNNFTEVNGLNIDTKTPYYWWNNISKF